MILSIKVLLIKLLLNIEFVISLINKIRLKTILIKKKYEKMDYILYLFVLFYNIIKSI